MRRRDIVSMVAFGGIVTAALGGCRAGVAAPGSHRAHERNGPAASIAEGLRKPGWQLTFDDEFNGSRLNRRQWMDSYPEGRTHGPELEYYAADDVSVGGGHLRLKAEHRTMESHDYTSGMVTSYGHFSQKFGLFEIRARFPRGKGMWPAFWLLPDNRQWPPEIDVLEILGHEPDKVYMTNHWTDEAQKHQQHGTAWKGPDFSAGYHTFAVDWEADHITWYVDGIERARSTAGIPQMPMYILANLAVGGDWPGSPDARTRFPAFMDVDYIRAYRRK